MTVVKQETQIPFMSQKGGNLLIIYPIVQFQGRVVFCGISSELAPLHKTDHDIKEVRKFWNGFVFGGYTHT